MGGRNDPMSVQQSASAFLERALPLIKIYLQRKVSYQMNQQLISSCYLPRVLTVSGRRTADDATIPVIVFGYSARRFER